MIGVCLGVDLRTYTMKSNAYKKLDHVPGSALFKYCIYPQKGYYLEQACTKCTYNIHNAIKQKVDIHEAGDKAIEKYM